MSARRQQPADSRWSEPIFQWRVEPDGELTPVGDAADQPAEDIQHQAAVLIAWELYDRGDPLGESELIRLGVFPPDDEGEELEGKDS